MSLTGGTRGVISRKCPQPDRQGDLTWTTTPRTPSQLTRGLQSQGSQMTDGLRSDLIYPTETEGNHRWMT